MLPEKEQYLIGVDAGGTKTTAQAYDLKGVLLESASAGFGNLTVDFDKGILNITQAIDALLKRMPDRDCIFICLGCAGIETGGKKQLAHKALSQRYGNERVYVTNDAMLALYSSLEGQDGALVIAGTGSIGYLKKEGVLHRFGGWGHLINDDGSGYTIAIRAIRAITDGFDLQKSEIPLKQAIFAKLDITELRELIDYTYHSTKGEIASLVPVIETVASQGDPQAQKILHWAGERIARLAIGLCLQNEMSHPNIAISGSVIKKTALVKKSFLAALDELLKHYTIYDIDFEPAKGAYYIYKERRDSL